MDGQRSFDQYRMSDQLCQYFEQVGNSITHPKKFHWPLPVIEQVSVNDGNESRSQITWMQVSFLSLVDPVMLADAFRITKTSTGIDVGQIAVAATSAGGKTVATLRFDEASTDGVQGNGNSSASLADGNYQLVISSDAVRDAVSGRVMKSDLVFGGASTVPESDNFFRLHGDSDGDRDVDGQDYGRVS